jgi:hypothetical protein
VKPRMGKAVQRDADRVLDFRIERENGEEELFQLKFRKSAPPTAEVIEGVLDSLMNESKVKADLAALRARLAQLEKALSGDLLFSDAGPAPTGSPPVLAELLMSFLAPKNSAQVQLGDLEEMFRKNAECYGEKAARRKYWMEVARSFGPLLLQWLERVSFVTVLIDYFRSKLGL